MPMRSERWAVAAFILVALVVPVVFAVVSILTGEPMYVVVSAPVALLAATLGIAAILASRKATRS